MRFCDPLVVPGKAAESYHFRQNLAKALVARCGKTIRSFSECLPWIAVRFFAGDRSSLILTYSY